MEIDKTKIYSDVDSIISETGSAESAVIPILQAIQKEYNYLPEIALKRVCDLTDITPASITGVASFFDQFRFTPIGKHTISICDGTACHVKGSDLVHEAFTRELKLDADQDTDSEGLFTLSKVSCLGCCMLAPVVQIDNVTYGHVNTNSVGRILRDFLAKSNNISHKHPAELNASESVGEVRVGLGSCCVAGGSNDVKQELEATLFETGINTNVKRVGCVGMCHRTPLLEVVLPDKEPILYDKITPEEVKPILLKHFKPKSLRKRLKNSAVGFLENILDDKSSDDLIRRSINTRDPQVESFLGRQVHIVTESSGVLDPLSFEEYQTLHGFEALKKCLEETSHDAIIDNIKSSGLRGRGGAGFPTGQKWEIVRGVEDEKKYIICNGDEGDPGAFMDRMILESYPYRVIEGMIIAAYAVGASEGYFYIRAEYPLAVERVKYALNECRKQGFLGENILNSGFALNLKVVEGAGAFVCGEETALIASIEGRRGSPEFRPPYPAHSGLWGHSTLINNCETYASVPWIMRNGADRYSSFGIGKSKGTKVFSLAGKIARGGLIEVPMGITIRKIVEDIGGGIENGGTFKAVQIGGPSGGCIPAELADTKVDFEGLTEAGSMMGSGGMLVMDQNDCMVEITRYFMTFACGQSCGKCTFCRIGTRHMLTLLEKICAGIANKSDLAKLEELAEKTKTGSLCGLGKTAPNPVMTTLTYFREEYEAHLNGICPAKQCKDLIQYSIDDSCIGCTICAQKCSTGAIEMKPYQLHTIDQSLCGKCGTCKEVCPSDSVQLI